MDNSRMIDGKKYIWDGEEYESESAAQENISKYRGDGFDTKLIEDDGKYGVYTRRVAKEIVLASEGS